MPTVAHIHAVLSSYEYPDYFKIFKSYMGEQNINCDSIFVTSILSVYHFKGSHLTNLLLTY